MSRHFVLLFHEGFRAALMNVVEYASRPENYYIVGKSKFIPGDVDEYCMACLGYEIVYSVTILETGQRLRHLTMSSPVGQRYPSSVAVFTIAHWVGFTGAVEQGGVVINAPLSWAVGMDEEEGCIVLQQEIG